MVIFIPPLIYCGDLDIVWFCSDTNQVLEPRSLEKSASKVGRHTLDQEELQNLANEYSAHEIFGSIGSNFG